MSEATRLPSRLIKTSSMSTYVPVRSDVAPTLTEATDSSSDDSHHALVRSPTTPCLSLEGTPNAGLLSPPKSMCSQLSSGQSSVILGERVVETEVKVPRIVRRESIRERTVTIPEKVITEEVVEETQTVRERIIQVKKPKVVEQVVQYVETEVVPVDIEFPVMETHFVEKKVEVPVYQEEIVVRAVPIEMERIVEVPGDTIKIETLNLKKVEKVEHQIVEVAKIKQLPPTIVNIDVPTFIEKEEFVQVNRRVPIASELTVNMNYHLPQLQSEYEEVQYPLFVPVFVQVPLPCDQLTDATVLECNNLISKIEHVTRSSSRSTSKKLERAASHGIPSLCAISEVAKEVRQYHPTRITDPALLRQRMAAKIATIDGKPSQCNIVQEVTKGTSVALPARVQSTPRRLPVSSRTPKKSIAFSTNSYPSNPVVTSSLFSGVLSSQISSSPIRSSAKNVK